MIPRQRHEARRARADLVGNRVLIIVQNLPVPFDRRVWLEATTLAKAGFLVSVICPRMKGFNASRETLENVEILRYPLPFEAQGTLGFMAEFIWCALLAGLLSFRVALFGRGFDILHVCNPPETYWPLGAWWRPFGKVFLFDHHDLSPEMFAVKFDRNEGLLLRALRAMEWLTFRVADVVITTNESHKAIALQRGGKRPGDVYVVRSGPDLNRFRVWERRDTWHAGKPFLIAYLGEICKQDGVDHLVTAMRILRDTFGRTDIHCVLMGSGPHQAAIIRHARALGVDDCCTFLGRVSDETLCRVLSSADLAVDPDPKNPWSDKSTMNKVVEYMFFGLPIVAYDLHETRVSAGEAAAYAAANDEADLAAAIVALLDDPVRRQRMAEFGERRLRSTLAWDHSVPVLLKAYRQASELARTRARTGPRASAQLAGR